MDFLRAPLRPWRPGLCAGCRALSVRQQARPGAAFESDGAVRWRAADADAARLGIALERHARPHHRHLESRIRRARLTLVFRSSFRSEEHTSELQSLMRISYAVFCLKKKQTRNTSKK